jgi:polar amino acid transport system substrate-binding protein
VRLLAAGRVELIAGFDQAFWAEADHLGIQGLIRELSPRIDEIPVYIAFTRARDMSAESRSIDRALRAMKEDGTYQKILARYFVTKTQ